MRRVRSSYWFVPSIMLVAAIALGAFMVWLDVGPASGLFDGISWYQRSKPEGAREMLSTIAGSMITVAGVVFSITIVAISFAASQYGPRILTNFMSDRGNQITLGTFVATFAYAVVVLRTIYGGESAFVPQLASAVGLLMALCSIAVLIYFIHHVPESIHVNTVAARIGHQLLHALDDIFPDREPDDDQRLDRAAASLFGEGADVATIPAAKDGYLQVVDQETLVELAHDRGLVIRLDQRPGDFVFTREVVAVVTPAPDEDACKEIADSWTVGTQRTPDEDPLFLVDELVEIAGRALSTGVNDPHTAITCVDWLSAAIAKIGRRSAPSRYTAGPDGELRLITAAPDFRIFINRSFGQLRPYLAIDINAAQHGITSLAAVAKHCSAEQRQIVRTEIDCLVEQAERAQQGPSLERLNAVAKEARAAT